MMQRFLKLFLRQNPTASTNYRGLDAEPVKQWKRNAIAAFLGSALGLYLGQYFPDLYYPHVQPYLPHIEQLHRIAPATQALKPAPDYPKSIHDTPENILVQMGRRKAVPGGNFVVRNDVTKEKQLFKVTRVFAPEGRDEVQVQVES